MALQPAPVPRPQPLHHAVPADFHAFAEDERGDGRDVDEREEERAEHGRRDGDRHRAEEDALGAGERRHRHVHHEDDEDAEEDRPRHLVRRLPDDPHDGPFPALTFEPRDHVLDHHDRAVHDHPEVDGAEAHEVGREPELAHPDEGEQHRERDHARHDERAADLAEQQQEHGDDEEAAFEEVRLHRVRRPPDEVGLVVEFFHADALG